MLSFLFFESKAQQYFVSSSYTFLYKKTLLKIWLNWVKLNHLSRNRALGYGSIFNMDHTILERSILAGILSFRPDCRSALGTNIKVLIFFSKATFNYLTARISKHRVKLYFYSILYINPSGGRGISHIVFRIVSFKFLVMLYSVFCFVFVLIFIFFYHFQKEPPLWKYWK